MKRKNVIIAGLIAAFALASAGCGGQGKLVELDIMGEYDQFNTAWDGRDCLQR